MNIGRLLMMLLNQFLRRAGKPPAAPRGRAPGKGQGGGAAPTGGPPPDQATAANELARRARQAQQLLRRLGR